MPWPNVSLNVRSLVQLMRSSGVFGKWGWFCRRPVSKMATVAFWPRSPWCHVSRASLPGATMTLYLAWACVRFLHNGVRCLDLRSTLNDRSARRAPSSNVMLGNRWGGARRRSADTQCRPSGPSFLETVARCFSLDAYPSKRTRTRSVCVAAAVARAAVGAVAWLRFLASGAAPLLRRAGQPRVNSQDERSTRHNSSSQLPKSKAS